MNRKCRRALELRALEDDLSSRSQICAMAPKDYRVDVHFVRCSAVDTNVCNTEGGCVANMSSMKRLCALCSTEACGGESQAGQSAHAKRLAEKCCKQLTSPV